MRLGMLALLAPIAWAHSQVPLRYKYESSTVYTQAMSPMDVELAETATTYGFDAPEGVKPPFKVWTSAILSITHRDSAGGSLVHIVVDSLRTNQFDSLASIRNQLPPEMLSMLSLANGGSIDAFILHGRQSQIRITPGLNALMGQVAAMIPFFVPRIPANANIGSEWSDTLVVHEGGGTPMISSGFFENITDTAMVVKYRMVSADSIASTFAESRSRTVLKSMTTKSQTLGGEGFALDEKRNLRMAELHVARIESGEVGEWVQRVTTVQSEVTLVRIGGSQ